MTTDEMDQTTPEDRYKLVALCQKCWEWHFFTGGSDRNRQTEGEICVCGGKRFDELRSARTWNLEWAKKTAAKLKKKASKK
jgi:hypothetical protein